MKPTLSLTRRYVLFLAAVIVALLLGTLVIVSSVVKDSLTDLLGQRFAQASSVVQQYSTVHYYTREAELRAVLTSPRFAAAIETEDSSTIAVEVPQYADLLSADFLVITDAHGRYLYRSDNIPARLHASLASAISNTARGIQISYVVDDRAIYETSVSEIIGNNGRLLGWIAAGKTFGSELATDLSTLTGFDVIITVDSQLIGFTPTRLAQALANRHGEFLAAQQTGKPFQRKLVGNEEILYASLQSDFSTARITFLASLDEHIAPLRSRVTLLLVLLAVGGGALAMLAIYLFTARRIGRQVQVLVTAAERIASGDTDFQIVPQSRDELGWLAGEFERMRAQLVANRLALEEAHEQQINSARLAAVGSMATGIIHDFKNPMAVVRGTADLMMLRDPENAKLQKYCATIHDQIDRMLDLTHDLLDFSRGRTQLSVKTVQMQEYCENIVGFHSVAYDQAGLQITCTGEPVEVTLDPIRFRRVVDNILNNAREALRSGDKVDVSWRVTAVGLHLRISDNGPGIPPEIAARLFEPFVTSNKAGGTGLGLAVAKKIVEDHGATIEVTSSPDQGAVFCIDFPARLLVSSSRQLVMKG